MIDYIIAAMMAVGAFFGLNDVASTDIDTVEIGLSEVSPRGEAGGFAIPASGCSYPAHGECTDPSITADDSIVRYGEDVEICWDPGAHTSCVLSSNLTGTATVAGCEDVAVYADTTYTISCDDGVIDEASVQVFSLPLIEET